METTAIATATASIKPPVFQMRLKSPATMPLFTMSAVRVGMYSVPNTCKNNRMSIAAALPL